MALARELRPDVVLMDIRMPVMDGLEATRRIVADDSLASCHVLVLTTYETDEYIFDAIRSGVSGFLLKDAEPAELLQAIRVVAAGDALLPGISPVWGRSVRAGSTRNRSKRRGGAVCRRRALPHLE